MSEPQRYPLSWPVGYPRTSNRREGKFVVGFSKARDGLLNELKLLGARHVVISSNLPLRQDGIPYADAPKRIADPGVAIYWTISKWDAKRAKYIDTPFVMACDRYASPAANMRALELSIDALRALKRHGTEVLFERAFTGFAALPAQGSASSWRAVLGLSGGPVTADDIARAYRERALKCHPDHGGTDEAMAELNRARVAALEEVNRAG